MVERPIFKLATGWTAAHAADLLLLAWIPLFLVSGGASAFTIGLVVAAHAAAWLLVSLPVGMLADTLSRRTIIMQGGVAIVCGALLGIVASLAGRLEPIAVAAIAFVIAGGVVAIALSVFVLVPSAVESDQLSRTNAVLEFLRAAVAIAAPLAAAALVTVGSSIPFFCMAGLAGAVAIGASWALPMEGPSRSTRLPLGKSIAEGGRFVASQPLLRAIALCAVAWNSAFFALTAVFAPYAIEHLSMSVSEIGRAWAVYGAGLLLGALCAPIMIGRLHTGFMLVFGPLLSCLGVLGMVASGGRSGAMAAYLALFCLGFGPMTWLVLQTSVRQLVTPKELLGRVGAVLTTAIYGVRPLGALAASAVTANGGPAAALGLAAGLFCVSVLAMLLSPAIRLHQLPVPATPAAE